ncbi:hypothetical protein BRYFOR_09866 [Marvinbryantia formatexigens DSM 14469]|uniref:Uncharacterized protein n=1 Tax=Marvinbryantia formatexigens DSM 14469 TaxID=478749 RepID=C6LMG5_9FIRM|nr:hypothetical protein BRYFOR_09866 [Marvinbryantia formatexigens DSM 14469]
MISWTESASDDGIKESGRWREEIQMTRQSSDIDVAEAVAIRPSQTDVRQIMRF